jgi:putative transcriptional regulator
MIKNRVRQARLACEFTQEALAQEVEVSRQTIIALEKGNYTPSVKLALQLASALGTTIEDLFWIESEE